MWIIFMFIYTLGLIGFGIVALVKFDNAFGSWSWCTQELFGIKDKLVAFVLLFWLVLLWPIGVSIVLYKGTKKSIPILKQQLLKD